MQFSLAVVSALLSLAAAQPLQVVKRDGPADQSGNTHVSLQCTTTTLPDPRSGGGNSFFQNNLKLTKSDGTTLQPSSCHPVKVSTLFQECVFQDSSFDGGSVTVHAENDPLGGVCEIDFGYKGEGFDSRDGNNAKCGHTGGGFSPFSNSETALCFFNA